MPARTLLAVLLFDRVVEDLSRNQAVTAAASMPGPSPRRTPLCWTHLRDTEDRDFPWHHHSQALGQNVHHVSSPGTTRTRDQGCGRRLTIVEHLTANGVMEITRLYESPFTDNAPQGPDMIFTDDQVEEIVTTLHQIRSHALPDLTAAS